MIYVFCILVVVLAVPLAWLLKREGERSWRRHQEMVRRQQELEALRQMTRTIQGDLLPAFQALGAMVQQASVAIQKMADALGREARHELKIKVDGTDLERALLERRRRRGQR